MQNVKKIHWVDPEQNVSQTGRQTDGQSNRTDFIGPLPQRWRFDHVFWKFENKIFLALFGLIVSHMERINTRKRNTINIVQR